MFNIHIYIYIVRKGEALRLVTRDKAFATSIKTIVNLASTTVLEVVAFSMLRRVDSLILLFLFAEID